MTELPKNEEMHYAIDKIEIVDKILKK